MSLNPSCTSSTLLSLQPLAAEREVSFSLHGSEVGRAGKSGIRSVLPVLIFATGLGHLPKQAVSRSSDLVTFLVALF